MKKIDAVVVTFNRKKLLLECIEAILSQSYNVNKLFIIDNASTDGTFDLLKENGYLSNKHVEYILLEKNIGGAGGFHEGIKLANKDKCDWVWIMDDDTIPNKNSLEELMNSLQIIDGKISFLASSVFGEKNEVMNVPTINLSLSENGYSDWYMYLKDGIVKINTATFVSILINNDAINNVGLPIKDYFIWGDDTEFTTRMTRFYGPAYFVGKSIVIHKRKISKSLTIIEENDKNRIKFFYYMIRNNYINTYMYGTKFNLIKYIVRNFLLYFKILFSSTNLKIEKMKSVRKGIFDGIFKNCDYNELKNRINNNE